MSDTEMIDWLERFVNKHGAMVLHTGDIDTGGKYGLGLRPGSLRRTLREAIRASANWDEAKNEIPN